MSAITNSLEWFHISFLLLLSLSLLFILFILFFLFQLASTNSIVYFSLKPMGICFLHYWPALPCFKSFVLQHVCELQPLVLWIQLTLMIAKPYTCVSNSPLRSIYCIINYPNLLNVSAGRRVFLQTGLWLTGRTEILQTNMYI